MTRGRTILAGGAIGLAAGIAALAGLWLQPAAPSAAPTDVRKATAEVVRGDLRDTKKVSGTLGYGELGALRPSLSEPGMVTWIAPEGSTVERGEPLFEIDGQPAILLYGTVPLHRTLRFEPDAAPVWVELEAAETAARSAELTLSLERERLKDAEARIADATLRLKDGLSDAPATAEFIRLAGAVRAAEAKLARVKELSAAELAPAVDVATVEAELAVARANLDGAVRGVRNELAGASLDAASARVAVAQAEVTLDEARNLTATLRARDADGADVAQLAENLSALGYEGSLAEQVTAWQRAAGLPVTGIVGPSQVVIATGAVHVAEHKVSVGETLGGSADRSAILDYSSIEKLVVVALGVADQALVAVGRTVTVVLPDDSEVEGTITEIGSVVTDNAIEVTIVIDDQAALAGLEVAAVDVEFVSASRDDVLSAPIMALLARPEGGFAVEVVSAGASHLVSVDTGLFAAGRVEISGDGIAEGVRVGVPG